MRKHSLIPTDGSSVSHGRKGAKALLLGGETQKVLTHSTIPVLVYR